MADAIIRAAIVNADGATRARRIGSANNYIRDTNLTNLLQNIDINNPKKFNYSLFSAFTAVPGLMDQLRVWARS